MLTIKEGEWRVEGIIGARSGQFAIKIADDFLVSFRMNHLMMNLNLNQNGILKM